MFVEHKEALEVTEAPVKITKLSDAIRIGSALRPQCTGAMFKGGGSCALGAAYEALFGYPGDEPESDVGRLYRIKERVLVPFDAFSGIGTYRNDNGWTREAVADWLEALGF